MAGVPAWQSGFSCPWGPAGTVLVPAVLVWTRRATIVAVESLVIGLFAWKVVADRRHSIHADAGGRHGARREDPSL